MSERHGTPSSFGFAVAVHPRDPDTAWFVPAQQDVCRVPVAGRFGVMRTRDGGDSFHLLTEGLPDAPAYHLVYRHGLDVDGASATLAMGSTTGSLWLGRDGGEHWSRVSAELPLSIPFASAARAVGGVVPRKPDEMTGNG